VRHRHRADESGAAVCRELVALRRDGSRGRLLIVFEQGPGRLVPDGYLPSGAVTRAEGPGLNLYEPGAARALLDEALARGWQPDDPAPARLDGWDLFDAVSARRPQAQRG
jgi:hypothetical protein